MTALIRDPADLEAGAVYLMQVCPVWARELPALLPLHQEMSPDTQGGAVLLGVDGICIISHGSSGETAMVNAIKGTQHPQGSSSIAEGIAVGTPGQLPQAIIARLVDDLVLVEEGDIEQAIVMLLEIEKTLVEGAGAAGLAALLKYPERFRGKRVGRPWPSARPNTSPVRSPCTRPTAPTAPTTSGSGSRATAPSARSTRRRPSRSSSTTRSPASASSGSRA